MTLSKLGEFMNLDISVNGLHVDVIEYHGNVKINHATLSLEHLERLTRVYRKAQEEIRSTLDDCLAEVI